MLSAPLTTIMISVSRLFRAQNSTCVCVSVFLFFFFSLTQKKEEKNTKNEKMKIKRSKKLQKERKKTEKEHPRGYLPPSSTATSMAWTFGVIWRTWNDGQNWIRKPNFLRARERPGPAVFRGTSVSRQRSTPNQISDAFSSGFMTPSLMPAGPDVWHMLDPSSMSVSLSLSLSHAG